jgi:hypothetical protein
VADGMTPGTTHADHDPELVASILDVDLDPGTRLAADALVASCHDCARLRDDLLALAIAIRAQPVPPRRRDFRLGASDAPRLRPATREPHPSAARLTGDMTDPRAASAHAAHDTMLLAALADGAPTGSERAAAEALVDGCGLCAATFSDLVDLRSATQSMPTPPRPRDYQLTEADAARLRPAGWRRWVAAFASPRDLVSRPLAIGLTTLGLAGLLVAGAPSLMQGGATSSGPTRDATITSPGASQQAVAAPELASGAPPMPATDAGSRVSAAPGVAFGPLGSPKAIADGGFPPTPQPVTGGTQNGGPIQSGDSLGGGVKPAGAGASGSGAGLTDNVSPTETDRLLNVGTEAGLPSLVTLSGVLVLLGLALFGLRWAAHRFGD